MTTTQLRQRLKARIDELSADNLPVVQNLLEFVEQGGTNAATEELRRIPGLVAAYRKAKRQASRLKGRSWRGLRSDV